MEDLFDWVSPELRAAIDFYYNPPEPWRELRLPPEGQPTVDQLVLPGDKVQFRWAEGVPEDKQKSEPKEALWVSEVICFGYEYQYHFAQTWGIRYPNGCGIIHGWQIVYQRPYKDWQIKKLHKRGYKLDAKAGDPQTRRTYSPPFVAIDGRILAMTYSKYDPPDDCELIVLKQVPSRQMDLWESVNSI